MLDIKGLNVHYGGIHALRGIDITVEEGSIVTLIGANGAGKSTTLRAIMSLEKPSAGQVFFEEKEITKQTTVQKVKNGFTLVPEGRRIFPNLTVYENLVLGAYIRKDSSVKKDIDWVMELFPRLSERIDQKGGTMSGGEQQMLAIGRALMSKPKLLMMDEPSLGLAPLIIKDIFRIIREINKQGMTILLIEQNANMALKIADKAYVLETGNIAMEGTGAELLENPEIKAAYLGKKKKK